MGDDISLPWDTKEVSPGMAWVDCLRTASRLQLREGTQEEARGLRWGDTAGSSRRPNAGQRTGEEAAAQTEGSGGVRGPPSVWASADRCP